MVRKKKSAYQRKARYYWLRTKKYAAKKTETSPDTKPIRGMRTAPPTNPFQPGNQQANLTDVHYLFPLCCNRNATSLITNNRGCVIPKRVINVYRNVYRIYFRTRECAFITGLVACCIVPFARSNLSSPHQPAIFVVSDFLYYLNSIASVFSQSP